MVYLTGDKSMSEILRVTPSEMIKVMTTMATDPKIQLTNESIDTLRMFIRNFFFKDNCIQPFLAEKNSDLQLVLLHKNTFQESMFINSIIKFLVEQPVDNWHSIMLPIMVLSLQTTVMSDSRRTLISETFELLECFMRQSTEFSIDNKSVKSVPDKLYKVSSTEDVNFYASKANKLDQSNRDSILYAILSQ